MIPLLDWKFHWTDFLASWKFKKCKARQYRLFKADVDSYTPVFIDNEDRSAERKRLFPANFHRYISQSMSAKGCFTVSGLMTLLSAKRQRKSSVVKRNSNCSSITLRVVTSQTFAIIFPHKQPVTVRASFLRRTTWCMLYWDDDGWWNFIGVSQSIHANVSTSINIFLTSCHWHKGTDITRLFELLRRSTYVPLT